MKDVREWRRVGKINQADSPATCSFIKSWLEGLLFWGVKTYGWMSIWKHWVFDRALGWHQYQHSSNRNCSFMKVSFQTRNFNFRNLLRVSANFTTHLSIAWVKPARVYPVWTSLDHYQSHLRISWSDSIRVSGVKLPWLSYRSLQMQFFNLNSKLYSSLHFTLCDRQLCLKIPFE